MNPVPDGIVDTERRATVRRLLHRCVRVGVGKNSLPRAVQRCRVAVEIRPTRTSRAERRELEVGRVGARALEDRVFGVFVLYRRVVTAMMNR